MAKEVRHSSQRSQYRCDHRCDQGDRNGRNGSLQDPVALRPLRIYPPYGRVATVATGKRRNDRAGIPLFPGGKIKKAPTSRLNFNPEARSFATRLEGNTAPTDAKRLPPVSRSAENAVV